MRALTAMDTIQIEITNNCVRSCSNCTRFCGHHYHPYYMSFDMFQDAVDSMIGYPKMTGVMGGEPLLHPEFEEFCKYIQTKIPKNQLGLWTGLPEGKEHHREIICATFGHIFINDHSRDDIYHCPILVASEEVIQDKADLFIIANDCWVQNYWSAAINPRGAFFCEIAASLSLLMEEGDGWVVERNWWKRTPKDFTAQIEQWCPKCGACLPLHRRASVDGRDDVSKGSLERLKGKSRKIDKGQYVLSDLTTTSQPEQMAAYKDQEWRSRVAKRYGIHLLLNDQKFLTPILLDKIGGSDATCKSSVSLFSQYVSSRS